MEKISKIFSKKKFKGEAHKLGSGEKDDPKKDKSSSKTPAQPTKVFKGKSYLASLPQPLPSALPNGNVSPQGQSSRQSRRDAPRTSSNEAVQEIQKPLERLDVANAAEPATRSSDFDNVGAMASASVEVRDAVGQLQHGPPGCSDTLQKILLNILRTPTEAKYRKVRLGNPRIRATVVEVDGGLELLQACGFLVDGMDSETDVFAYLPEDEELQPLIAALSLLGHKFDTPGEIGQHPNSLAYQEPHASGSSKVVPAPAQTSVGPCDRETTVIVPIAGSGGGELASWVYERSPAELKAAIQSAQRKREQSEVLMTRAMREKLQSSGPKPKYTKSVVRIRLPEGLLLQGHFNAGEHVATIFDWVTDCLADSDTTYSLCDKLQHSKALSLKPEIMAKSQHLLSHA